LKNRPPPNASLYFNSGTSVCTKSDTYV
jgi:hypothetical protein